MILGISALHHDSAVTLTSGKDILFASHLERFSRVKFDSSWPDILIEYVIKNYGDPDQVVFHDQLNFLKRQYIRSKLKKFGLRRCEFIEHHLSHVYSSLAMNDWSPGAVLVIDTKGGKYASSLGYWDGHKLVWLKRFYYPQSLGLFYSSATQLLGLSPLYDEQKVMSAAIYGSPIWESFIKKNFLDYGEGSYTLLKDFRRGFGSGTMDFNIACSVQKVLEDVIVSLANWLHKETNSHILYYSGGVALNCVANTKILQRTNFKNVYVPPAAGDAGGALGAASWSNKSLWKTAYLGVNEHSQQTATELAEDIVKNKIVKVINGKAEFGPRALGNRSFLALPNQISIDQLNTAKQRHSDNWRPWAPVCRAVDAKKYFNIIRPSYEMMFVAYKKNNNVWIDYPDKSARLQIVDKNYNPFLYEILTYTAERGHPVLINTSLNVKGKPMVNITKDLHEFNG